MESRSLFALTRPICQHKLDTQDKQKKQKICFNVTLCCYSIKINLFRANTPLTMCVWFISILFPPNNFRLFILKKHENIYCRKELLIISFNPYTVLVICSDFHIKIVTSKIQYVHFFFFTSNFIDLFQKLIFQNMCTTQIRKPCFQSAWHCGNYR